MGPATNFSNYNMTFTGAWLATRYLCDDDARAEVARGVGLLAAILDPHVIVLGGSVAGAFDCFEEAVQGRIGEYLAPSAAEQLKIVASSAGAASAALGAAALIFSGHREEQ